MTAQAPAQVQTRPRTKLLSFSIEQFEQWWEEKLLQEKIRKLSIAALASGTFTCTVCGEKAGYYVIKTGKQTYHLPTQETYQLLQTMTA